MATAEGVPQRAESAHEPEIQTYPVWVDPLSTFLSRLSAALTCLRSFYQTKLRNSVQNSTSFCP
jgi:hypothetical protein